MTTAVELEIEPTSPEGDFVPQRMTIDEWNALDEDETGEFVDGWLVEEEVPSELHEGVVAWLVFTLTSWGRPRGARVRGSGTKLTMSVRGGRTPDALVWFSEGRRPPAQGAIRIPPSVVVEVVTATRRDERRDRVAKYAEYAAFGIPFYWIVDPAMRTIEIYELLADGRYARAASGTDGTLSTVPGCPDLVLDLDALWAECDEIERG